MDKRVILSVAGSGKTTYLVNKLDEEKRFLLVTFTNNNANNLRTRIIKKFGYVPRNIKVYTYFSFLYNFCYKPLLHKKLGTRGINYNSTPNRFARLDERKYYIDDFHRLYSSRISKLLLEHSKDVIERVCKYFDYLMIDEVQDFAGNDFNLLKHLSQATINHTYVGDFYQHTFDTSRDGNVNGTLHNNLTGYLKQLEKLGITIDITTLSKSYRCSSINCHFITEQLGIKIESHRSANTKVEFINDKEMAIQLLKSKDVVKLFYKEHHKYGCFSKNWGESKGEDHYYDVCIILNKTTLDNYNKGKLKELAPTTRNKLYVALSRANNNLYLLPDRFLK